MNRPEYFRIYISLYNHILNPYTICYGGIYLYKTRGNVDTCRSKQHISPVTDESVLAIISNPSGPFEVIKPTSVANCLVRPSFHARCIGEQGGTV